MGRKFEFDFIPLTTDQIRDLSEEDLYKNIGSFRRKIKEAIRAGRDTQPYEVEFCYLDHERIMREKSKEAHFQFMKTKRQNFRPDRFRKNEKPYKSRNFKNEETNTSQQ